MRIIAGQYGSRRIKAPEGSNTRPTSDKVRESLFSSLLCTFPAFEDACVLDAFAGSGALGLEALSRGATKCVFFEKDRKAHKVLLENIRSLNVARNQAYARCADVFKAHDAARPANWEQFDLVFLDPPYDFRCEQIFSFIKNLAHNGYLNAGARIVYEHRSDNAQEVEIAAREIKGLCGFKQKRFGSTMLSTLDFE